MTRLQWLALGVLTTACALDPDPRASFFEADSEGDDMTATSGATGGPIVDGSVVTIYDIQQGRVPVGTTVRVENVVVSSPLVAAEGAMTVQDPMGGPFSGIYLFLFEDVAMAVSVAPGDIVTLTGEYDEFFDASQLTVRAATDFEVVGQGPPPAPLVVPAADIVATNQDAEQYESVLVQVDDAAVTNPDAGFGDWEVEGGVIITNFFLDAQQAAIVPTAGSTFDSIAGPLLYSFEQYRIAPRTPADVVGGTNVPAEPASIYELQAGMVQVGAPVIVEDIVVTTPVSDGRFWVQDPMGGQLSGIAVFVAEVGQGIAVQPGSRVTLTGTYDEFFEQSQLEVPSGTGVEILGATEVPAPAVLPSSEIGSGQAAEPWEGVLVRVEDAVVSDATDMFGDWRVDRVLFITDLFLPQGAFPMPAVSDPYTSITGVLTYSFEEYRLAPRTSGDLVPG